MNYELKRFISGILFTCLLIPVGAVIISHKTISEWLIRSDNVYLIGHALGSSLANFELVRESAFRLSASYFDVAIALLMYCVFALGSFLLWRAYLKTVIHPSEEGVHQSGPVLLTRKHAIKHLANFLKKEKTRTGFAIHPSLKLSSKLEALNTLVFGMQGAGKSTLIKQWLLQIVGRKGCKSFIYDEKGEYQELLVNNSNTIMLSVDEKSHYWDIGSDIKSNDVAELIAHGMIEDTIKERDFFVDAARTVLAGVFYYLIETHDRWSWSELSALLFCSDEELQKALQKVFPPALPFIIPESKTTQSVRSLISAQLSWIASMPKVETMKPFSISDWLNTNATKRHVVLKASSKKPAKSRSLVSSMMTIITNSLLDMRDSKKRQVWMVLDELGNLPKSPALKRWLSLSRSKGGRMIAGTQSISMVEEVYGKASTESILSLFGVIVAMRLGASGSSSETASHALGNCKIKQINETIQSDGSRSISYISQERPVVPKEDIVHLPLANASGVEGYLLIGGSEAVYRLKWPYPKVPPQSSNSSLKTSGLSKKATARKDELRSKNRLNRRPMRKYKKETS